MLNEGASHQMVRSRVSWKAPRRGFFYLMDQSSD